ncbi:MAG: hypothetical protein EPO40_08680 [Myxococcaceae bacterium]|nr:MAG: hypothetical protein EPO40_08680 [Myxococcaceae bacterium]
MSDVELIYSPDCPNVSAAREQLRRALREVGLAEAWREHDLSAHDVAPHARGFGSPTVLVDGRDVSGGLPSDGATCRVYAGSEERGAPPVGAIVSALRGPPRPSRRVFAPFAVLATLPGVLLAALPVVACPACWPAYAGALSAMGVPFLMRAEWLLPLTAAALTVALSGLAFRAPRRRGYGPLALGAVASVGVLAGKFVAHVDGLVYGALALLVAVSIWNSVPRRPDAAVSRDACGCPPTDST